MSGHSPSSDEVEDLPLSKAAQFLLEESRMVLPGMQALFGFQLVVIFNPSFEQRLSTFEQRLHLLAIALVAVGIAIIMTPAAFHRCIGATVVTTRFIRASTRLLLFSMPPLAAAICLDFYLVGCLVVGVLPSIVLAATLFVTFVSLWFVLPRARRRRHLEAARRARAR